MEMDAAFEQFTLRERRRLKGEDGQARALALDALREFLLEKCGYEQTSSLTRRDLLDFLFSYYPSEVEPDGEVWSLLLETCEGWVAWLAERDERSAAGFLEWSSRLRVDIPRVSAAFTCLSEHLAACDLSTRVAVEDRSDENGLGSMSAGLDRLVDVKAVDLTRAEEEYYTVQEVRPGGLTLSSLERDALGEGWVGPLFLPEAAASVLKVGDVLHLEIAPADERWEVVELFKIIPGGYQ